MIHIQIEIRDSAPDEPVSRILTLSPRQARKPDTIQEMISRTLHRLVDSTVEVWALERRLDVPPPPPRED